MSIARPTLRRRTAGALSLSLAVAGVTAAGVAPAQAADPVDVQILATNDFHGRISANGAEAGAAVLAGAVQQLRAENPNTVFAAAGDLIGASTFDSFIQHDKPTIDALNAAGLDVSAVGNHELDQGYDDLMNRVLAPYDADTNPYGGAQWQYVAANLKLRATGDDAVPASWIKDFGDVQVGFVGAVTEELGALVSPSGIADLEVRSIVETTNAEADALKAEGADVVVLLVHDGATTTECATMPTAGNAFASIVNDVSPEVDAIVSGHTHLAYDCAFPVDEWAGQAVTERPVVSAGQYGTNLNQLEYSVDPDSGEVQGVTTGILALSGNYPAAPEVTEIVADAVAEGDVLGAEPLGQIGGELDRAQRWGVDPDTGEDVLVENRGGESTLGNLVAEVQRWATETPEAGGAQIAFMNPGGLRADLVGSGDGEFPRTVTYKQAATVQPFANTLVNMQLTGAQIKSVLEQQWQRDATGKVPSRPFLRLGVSAGFEYTYDPARPEGDRITGMWLDDEPIGTDTSYSVTVNSFLSTGGDNFRAFADGTGARDTGKIDLSAFVDYMATFAADSALQVDPAQHAVGVSFPADAPDAYAPGDTVTFDVSSWAMTGSADVTDAELTVSLDGAELGTAAVDSTVGSDVFDEVGTASVQVTLPARAPAGTTALTLTGAATGTEITVPIEVTEPAKAQPTITVDAPATVIAWFQRPRLDVTVESPDGTPTGKVTAVIKQRPVDSDRLDRRGEARLRVGPFSPGTVEVEVRYSGDDATEAATVTQQIKVKSLWDVIFGGFRH
ncbi:5'-nucleotidase C-terminal domain-containing protein [Isoptericola sp. NEAU-Y5]|uniref:5'-nucleotidase C-terminal domain-containing protein n=1 Tax=Isoptericola luteus TaxID=2879484 RepID=A0ABS7ZHC3_9MICO|nr:5'-nucleotidase C-terminal domain-containing protein [Isoptericola sp. NEAU-Y5]MCA5894435.1 5'-nucleotidase C-terminal domain-containing protein [Isoptericola sp. NEAU-Y5]